MKHRLHLKKVIHCSLSVWIAVMMMFVAGHATAQTLGDEFTKNNIQYKVTQVSPAEVIITGNTLSSTTTTLTLSTVENNSVTYSVTGIRDSSFYNSSLTSASFPQALLIGKGAFAGSTSLKTLLLPEATTIQSQFIDRCTALKSLTLPKVTSIESYTFDGCKLDSLTMDVIDSIPPTALASISTLSYVNLPKAKVISPAAFEDDTALKTLLLPEATKILSVFIENCTSLKSLTLPKVTSITSGTFGGCKLDSLTMDVIDSIPGGALAGISTLSYVNLPKAKVIMNAVFMDCTSLKSLLLPEATTIQSQFIGGCTALKSLTLPKVTYITNGTFYECQLDSLTMDVIDSIPNGALAGISTLSYVNLPKAKVIMNAVFAGCTSLKSLLLPEATTIQSQFIGGCTALKSLTLPKVTYITNGTFYDCQLDSLTMDVIDTIPAGAFVRISTLSYVNLPKAKVIMSEAFGYDTSLKTLLLPEATEVKYGFIDNCTALKSLTLPKVKSIAPMAFLQCIKLASLSLGATPPTVYDRAFEGCPAARKLRLVDENGTLLSGAALKAAIAHYKQDTGYDAETGLWYGWDLMNTDLSAADILLPQNSYEANGSQLKPAVTVVMDGTTLTEGTDYTVTYGENVKPGQGTVTVTGIGHYSGSQTIAFTLFAKPVYVIIPKVDGVSVNPGFGLNLSSIGSPFEFTVTPDAALGKEGTDFTLEVRTDKGETLYPNGNSYKIATVDHETTVYINVTKLHTTGVETLSALNVYGGQGSIAIVSPMNTTALIVNLTGKVVTSTKIVAGKTTFSGLQRGIYIVKAGTLTTKVVVK